MVRPTEPTPPEFMITLDQAGLVEKASNRIVEMAWCCAGLDTRSLRVPISTIGAVLSPDADLPRTAAAAAEEEEEEESVEVWTTTELSQKRR